MDFNGGSNNPLPRKKAPQTHTLAYNFMDLTDSIKPMDKNPRVKENPSIWPASYEAYRGVPVVVQQKQSHCYHAGPIPGLTQWVKDPALLLWCRSQTQLRSSVAVVVV